MTKVCVPFTGIVLVPLSSSPVTGHYTEDSGLVLFVASSQVLMHIDKIPPWPSLLQVKKSWLSQIVPVWQILQALSYLFGPSLDSLQ